MINRVKIYKLINTYKTPYKIARGYRARLKEMKTKLRKRNSI